MHRNKAEHLIQIRQSTGLVSARTCVERQRSEIQKRYELEGGPRKIMDFSGQRDGYLIL